MSTVGDTLLNQIIALDEAQRAFFFFLLLLLLTPVAQFRFSFRGETLTAAVVAAVPAAGAFILTAARGRMTRSSSAGNLCLGARVCHESRSCPATAGSDNFNFPSLISFMYLEFVRVPFFCYWLPKDVGEVEHMACRRYPCDPALAAFACGGRRSAVGCWVCL